MLGRVISVNRERGFGHARADGDAGLELFFHASAVIGEPIEALSVGDHIEFEPAVTARGPAAYAVRHATLEGVVGYLLLGGPGRTGFGYGFIHTADGGDEDRYFHHSGMRPVGLPPGQQFSSLTVGQHVFYREARGRPGQRQKAVDVRLISDDDRLPLVGTDTQELITMTTETDDMRADRREGTVARIVADRGFFFIRPHNAPGRASLFCHYKSLPPGTFDDLQGGERVSFVEGVDRNGRPCATDTRLLDADDTAVA